MGIRERRVGKSGTPHTPANCISSYSGAMKTALTIVLATGIAFAQTGATGQTGRTGSTGSTGMTGHTGMTGDTGMTGRREIRLHR